MKSAELTGIWEKKLREIERRSYDPRQFLDELKQMVADIVYQVLSDNTNRRVSTQENIVEVVEKEVKRRAAA